MAIYHLEVKIITRSTGRSAVSAAAYRSGDVLTNEWDGVTHDYSRKGWIEYSEIMLPDNAPHEFMDRSTLWNAVEMKEDGPSAQLAREIEIALPGDLTLEQQIELTEQYVRENFVDKGMCADFSIHNPPVTDANKRPVDSEGNPTKDESKMIFRNPHAHIMLTMRPLDENGQWEDRYQKAYVCRKDGKQKAIPCPMMDRAKKDGWQKLYQYRQDDKKVWMTKAEAEKEGLERVSKQPLCHNIPNPVIQKWNSRESLLEWRKNWADITNRTFERYGIDAHIDHRSYEEQGIDKVPTTHLGPGAYRMEKEGRPTDRGDFNRQCRKDNEFLEELRGKLQDYEKKEAEHLKQAASQMEGARADCIASAYQSLLLSASISREENEEQRRRETAQATSEALDGIISLINQLEKLLGGMTDELESLNPFQNRRRKELEDDISRTELRIQDAKEQMAELEAEQKELKASYNPKEAEFREAEKMRLNELKTMELEARKEFYWLQKENRDNLKELKELIRKNRPLFEKQVRDSLMDYYKDSYSEDIYEEARRSAPGGIYDDDDEGETKSRHKTRRAG